MKYKVITPITVEPLSLSDVKTHLKLNSGSFSDNITTTQSLLPISRTAGTYNGTSVNIAGKQVIVNVNSGTNQTNGTVDVVIQESDDNISFTNWAYGTFMQITTANDNALYEKEYTGSKNYIRASATFANASCTVAVDIITSQSDTTEDTLLSSFISAAREYAEDYTKHAFAPQTIDYYLQDWPSTDCIEWPFGPLTSVTSVKYKNSSGVESTLTENTNYIVDANSFPGIIFLPYNSSWPTFTAYPYNAISIRGVCGYTGSGQYALPKNYKQAMLMHVGFMYKYRDTEIPSNDLKTINVLYGMRRSLCI